MSLFSISVINIIQSLIYNNIPIVVFPFISMLEIPPCDSFSFRESFNNHVFSGECTTALTERNA